MKGKDTKPLPSLMHACTYNRFAALSLNALPLLMKRVKIIPMPVKNTALLELAAACEVLLI